MVIVIVRGNDVMSDCMCWVQGSILVAEIGPMRVLSGSSLCGTLAGCVEGLCVYAFWRMESNLSSDESHVRSE